MFWTKSKDERIEDGVKFAIVFLIISIIVSIVSRNFNPAALYFQMLICRTLLDMHINHKYHKEFNMYDKSIKKLRDFAKNNKKEIDIPSFGIVESIDVDSINDLPNPVDIPEDKRSELLYAVSTVIATILAEVSIFVLYSVVWGGGIVNFILFIILGGTLLLNTISYLTTYNKIISMRLCYMDIYIPFLMMKCMYQFGDLFESKLKDNKEVLDNENS